MCIRDSTWEDLHALVLHDAGSMWPEREIELLRVQLEELDGPLCFNQEQIRLHCWGDLVLLFSDCAEQLEHRKQVIPALGSQWRASQKCEEAPQASQTEAS
eukprot:TRINITY_DN22991_c0_g1_i1.p1 TRINITY_DN22991_c0_g1~~TRINITY_DN22991_c0_g1_i1.p1  ORF type:complete len:101 (+),score=25.27 TRINITY_DN22991_c0_g1_i1:103-405(+)